MSQSYIPPPCQESAMTEPMDWEPTNAVQLAALKDGTNTPHTGQNNRQTQQHA